MNIRSKILVSLVLAFLVLVGVSIALSTDDPKEKECAVTWEELPQAVQKTILMHAGDHKITELEEVTVGEEVFYEAEWLEGDMEVNILVDASGKFLQREVEKADAEDDAEDEDDTEKSED